MKKIDLKKISNVTDKAAYNFFINKAENISFDKGLSNIEKRNEVKKIRIKSILISSLLGAGGVFFLFLPVHVFPELFPTRLMKIPFLNFQYEYSISELIYSLFLVALEIWLLIINDLKNVGKIAKVYNLNIPHSVIDIEVKEMVNIGLGKDKKKFIEVGINPYQRFSKPGIIFIRSLFLIKAFLSNFAFRIIIKKVFGRMAIRSITDFAGIPIYAFWNAYASAIVIRRADMRMLASKLMVNTGNIFYKQFNNNIDFKNFIYDTLEYIAITKNNFYPADYLFAKHLLDTFNIEIQKEHKLSDNYIEKVRSSTPEIKTAISQILIIGFLIDGKSGSFEIRALKRLIEKEIIPYSIAQIKKWTKDYTSGNGFSKMFNLSNNFKK